MNNTWAEALKWVKKEWKKRSEDLREHPSFLACKILEEAEKQFNLPTYGTEGFCGQDWGDYQSGVSYLNTGDTYDTTLVCTYFNGVVRFKIDSWGDTYERFETRMIRENGVRSY